MGEGTPCCYQVADWVNRYEDHRSKSIKRLTWFPMPTRTNDDSRLLVIDGERKAEAQGVWIGILLVAASQEEHPRGELRRFDGQPHTPETLARQIGLEAEIVTREWGRFLELGLIEQAPAGDLTRSERREQNADPLDEALTDLGHRPMAALSFRVQQDIRHCVEKTSLERVLGEMRDAVGREKERREIGYILAQIKTKVGQQAFAEAKETGATEAEVPDY